MLMAAANIFGNGVPWDVTDGYYAGSSSTFSGEDTGPRGMALSQDGSKAYMVGGNTDAIYQYTLSTAWDISTGSYASKSLSVAAQDINPECIAFSSDGSKAYMAGQNNDTIYQYTLSTAWDISTGSYASKSLSVAAQVGIPGGLAFSSDGTKCYVLDSGSDAIYQYTLSTAWDISTGSYASKSLSVLAQLNSGEGLAFSSDGTKCYVLNSFSTLSRIYQYTLSTAWDISTGSYASKRMWAIQTGTSPVGLAFQALGERLYIIGGSYKFDQYNLV